MAQYTPASLESLLKGLSISSEDGPNHEQILEHCDKVLSTTKAHPRALHTKIVALLNLDHYDEALRVFESLDGHAVKNATLEKAYCLYKLGKLEEAQEVAKGAADGGDRNKRGLRHVEAQAAYRLENFPRAAEIYKDLADGATQVDNEEYDTSVNATATEAQLVWSGNGHLVKDSKTARGALDAFETAFNVACISIAKGELGQALVLLKRSKDLCNAIEDLSEEDKKIEEAPIVAQEVYVLTRMGRIDDAIARSKDLGIENLTDTALKLIATHNEIAATSRLPDYNPHSSLIVAESAVNSAQSSSARPFLFQALALERNGAVLDFEVGKLAAVKKQSDKHAETYPNDPVNGVLRAAAVAGNIAGKEAQNKIVKLLAANPKDTGLALTLVQLKLRAGNITGAIQTVDTLLAALEPEQRYQPGLIGLQVALYQSQGRKQHIKELLQQASNFWKSSSSPNPSILRASGSAQLDSADAADLLSAGELFTSLLAANPNDKLATCGFIASYATTDASKLTPAHLAKLAPIDKLIADIDAATLESLGVAQPTRKRAAEEEARPKEKQKKVKKKPAKIPADLVGKTPDPERWLPVKDRSTYRPKGKKDKKKAAGATQGGATGPEESMEMVGGGKLDVKKAAGGGAGGAGKKKKKKGTKW